MSMLCPAMGRFPKCTVSEKSTGDCVQYTTFCVIKKETREYIYLYFLVLVYRRTEK